MATPTSPSRRFYGCAAAQGSVWGTAVAVGAADELFVTSDGDPALKQEFKPFGGLNQVLPADGDLGPSEAIDFSPEFGGEGCGLQYEMGATGSLIVALFGTSTSVTQQGATTAYQHVIDWANEVSDFFTFVTERPGDIWEIPSCVPQKLTLKPGNGFLQGSITLRGNHLNNTSTTNTATQADAITKAASGGIIRFQDGVFRINAQSGDALDSGDNVTLSDFEVTLERTMDALQVLGGTYIAQPAESAFAGTLKIKLPHESGTAATWFATYLAKTAQKASLTFTSSDLAGTGYPYVFTIAFPRLMPKVAPGVKLEEIINSELEFLVLEASAAPSGMTGHTRPYLEVTNKRSTAYIS
jgi:predicted RecA/RadA family phage recombinase